MPIVESHPVFADFGVAGTAAKADGTGTRAITGLYDEAGFEFETERGSTVSRQPQIIMTLADAVDLAEGDTITLGGTAYEILDRLADSEIATFNVSPL